MMGFEVKCKECGVIHKFKSWVKAKDACTAHIQETGHATWVNDKNKARTLKAKIVTNTRVKPVRCDPDGQ